MTLEGFNSNCQHQKGGAGGLPINKRRNIARMLHVISRPGDWLIKYAHKKIPIFLQEHEDLLQDYTHSCPCTVNNTEKRLIQTVIISREEQELDLPKEI